MISQVLTSTGPGSAPVWRNASTLGSGAFVLSYTTVASGTSLTGSVLLPYGFAVVDVQDDGTASAHAWQRSGDADIAERRSERSGAYGDNGGYPEITHDLKGLMISSSSFSLIDPARSVRFVWSGGMSGSWKRQRRRLAETP